MIEELSLRERKKQATRIQLMETALTLFEERGFDNVSVAEVAAAADVSKATVFNYFPVKEDLVVGGAKEHIEEPAQVVRNRSVGQTPHGAMREYFLRMLKNREPMSGLSDHPLVLRVHGVIRSTPALVLRSMDFRRQAAAKLADVLIEEGSSELTAQLVAVQLMHMQHMVSQHNVHRIHEREAADDIYPDAVAAAEHAFRLLEHGIGDFMRRGIDSAPIDAAFCGHCPPGGSPAQEEGVEEVLSEAADEVLEDLLDPDQP